MSEEQNDCQIIETGDSVKVKQVLDDAAMEAVSDHSVYHPLAVASPT